MTLVTSRLAQGAQCPVCGEPGATCGPTHDAIPVDDIQEVVPMAGEKLVLVEQTTESGTKYYTKVPASQAPPKHKARQAPENPQPTGGSGESSEGESSGSTSGKKKS